MGEGAICRFCISCWRSLRERACSVLRRWPQNLRAPSRARMRSTSSFEGWTPFTAPAGTLRPSPWLRSVWPWRARRLRRGAPRIRDGAHVARLPQQGAGPLCRGRAALPTSACHHRERTGPRPPERGTIAQLPGHPLREPGPLRRRRAARQARTCHQRKGAGSRPPNVGTIARLPGQPLYETRAATPRPSRSPSVRLPSTRKRWAPTTWT